MNYKSEDKLNDFLINFDILAIIMLSCSIYEYMYTFIDYILYQLR